MTATEFFEYLHDHPATTSLAETMAAVLIGPTPAEARADPGSDARRVRQLTTDRRDTVSRRGSETDRRRFTDASCARSNAT